MTLCNNTFEDIKRYLPHYLSDPDKSKLFSELANFPKNINKNFYSNNLKTKNPLLQGDGIIDINWFSPDLEKTLPIKAIILSNTCDIDLANQRLFSPYIVVAPLFKLDLYKDTLLKKHNKTSVESHISDIIAQRTTNFFYLPSTDNETCSYFARLDMSFSVPLSKEIVEDKTQSRLFCLSQYGFYVLLLKIAIHFSRIQEGVIR